MSFQSSWLSVRRTLPLLLGTAALALVWGRFALEGHRAVGAAEAALAAGDRAEAVRSYLDALRFYVPGSPAERRAVEGLGSLANAARAEGDGASERQALQAMRTGLLGTRGFFEVRRDSLAAAESRLRELDAADGVASVELTGPAGGHHGPGRMASVRGSAVLSTLIAMVGLATWMGAVALMVRNALEARGGRVPGGVSAGDRASAPVWPAGGLRVLVPVLFAAGVALFLVGLRFT